MSDVNELLKEAIKETENLNKGINEYLKELKNIEFLYLPSYCSELNAIEHLWKNIRAAVTHNTLFDQFTELLN